MTQEIADKTNQQYKQILEDMLKELKAQLETLQSSIFNIEDAIKRIDEKK